MQSAASSAHSAPPAAPPSFRIIPTPLSCWRTTHHKHTNSPDRSFHQLLDSEYPLTQHWEFSYLFREFLVNYIIKKQRIIVTPPKRHCHSNASTLKAGGCDFVVGKRCFVLVLMRSRARVRECGWRNKSLTDVRAWRWPGPDWDWEPAVAVGSHAAAINRRYSLRYSGTTSDDRLRNFTHHWNLILRQHLRVSVIDRCNYLSYCAIIYLYIGRFIAKKRTCLHYTTKKN